MRTAYSKKNFRNRRGFNHFRLRNSIFSEESKAWDTDNMSVAELFLCLSPYWSSRVAKNLQGGTIDAKLARKLFRNNPILHPSQTRFFIFPQN